MKLDKISIYGFKSIKELCDFPLHNLNVIVGGNGAGKSNFIDFFRMLKAMADEGLQGFVIENGGADTFFFNGTSVTKKINASLKFGYYNYEFELKPTVDSLMIKSESGYYQDLTVADMAKGGETKESILKKWESCENVASRMIYEAISQCMVYHFHDTDKKTAAIRKESPVYQWNGLDFDGSNLAATLYRFKSHFQFKANYEKIVSSVRLVAPFIEDFILEPYEKGGRELVRLQWKQKGSSCLFDPWQLSDGTLRFIALATVLLQPEATLPATVIIDEPELGLHPFALDVLAGLMQDAAQRTQLIVATQSATLLNCFEPKDIIVSDRVDGASIFNRLDNESMAGWLEDYTLGQLWHKNVFDGGPACE